MNKNYEYFLNKAKSLYGDRFIYPDDIENFKQKSKITFYDNQTEKEYTQFGDKHLRGLPKELKSKGERITEEVIFKRLNEWHPDLEFNILEFKKSNSLIEVNCKLHGKFSRVFKYLNRNTGCPSCSKDSATKLSSDFGLDSFLETQKMYPHCDFSQSIYINARTPVKVIDKEYGEYFIEPYVLARGPEKGNHEKRRSEAYLNTRKEAFYSLVKKTLPHYEWYDDYVGMHDNVTFKCPVHGINKQPAHTFQKGGECRSCSYERRAQGHRLTQEEYLERIRKARNVDKLQFHKIKYINLVSNIELVCPNHGPFLKRADRALETLACPFCSLTRGSSYEKELYDFLIDCGFKSSEIVVNKYYPWLDGKQLDLFIPIIDLAIEFNGAIYHHSSNSDNEYINSRKVSNTYHEFKFKGCKEKGINLIHIFEFEDMVKWKRKLKLYFNNPEKYNISFENSKRTENGLIYYGKSYIKENL